MADRSLARSRKWCRCWDGSAPSGLRFALETGQGLGIFGNVIRQELESDKPVQRYILGLVDYSHPNLSTMAVVRNSLADHGVRAIVGLM
jgi:hypothetical protein